MFRKLLMCSNVYQLQVNNLFVIQTGSFYIAGHNLRLYSHVDFDANSKEKRMKFGFRSWVFVFAFLLSAEIRADFDGIFKYGIFPVALTNLMVSIPTVIAPAFIIKMETDAADALEQMTSLSVQGQKAKSVEEETLRDGIASADIGLAFAICNVVAHGVTLVPHRITNIAAISTGLASFIATTITVGVSLTTVPQICDQEYKDDKGINHHRDICELSTTDNDNLDRKFLSLDKWKKVWATFIAFSVAFSLVNFGMMWTYAGDSCRNL